MSSLKSVIITLAKGLPKAIPTSELTRNALPKLSFATSILTDKVRMDARKVTTKQHQQEEAACDDTAALFKPADVCVRGKKRRLDHLTWEEKLQRKKLKNRVAAQTSRDRKKAKLDELEDTVRTLRERNELLTQECTMLRSQNESLLNETKRLRRETDTRNDTEQHYCSLCQTRVGCAVPSLGSTAGWDSTAGIVPDADARSCRPAEDPDSLPPLEELFGDLQSDDYIERLEELAESLLREVTAEVEAHPHRSNEQVSEKEDPAKKPDHSETMVGQAPENVEADRAAGSVNASYLHGRDSSSSWHSVICGTTNDTPLPAIKTEIEIKQESEPAHDLEATLYGTYDEATNSITIIYPGEENGGVGIQECVQEVSTDGTACHTGDDVAAASNVAHLTAPSSHRYTTQFSPAYTCHTESTMSPASVHSDADTDCCIVTAQVDCLSDGGYESHGSPCGEQQNRSNALIDLWHESFTELFPALA